MGYDVAACEATQLQSSDLVVSETLNYAHLKAFLTLLRRMRFDPVATAPGSVLSGASLAIKLSPFFHSIAF